MAKLAIRVTSDRKTRETVITGDEIITITCMRSNRPTFEIVVSNDEVIRILKYSNGTTHNMRQHGCIECGLDVPLGNYCELCAKDIPT